MKTFEMAVLIMFSKSNLGLCKRTLDMILEVAKKGLVEIFPRPGLERFF